MPSLRAAHSAASTPGPLRVLRPHVHCCHGCRDGPVGRLPARPSLRPSVCTELSGTSNRWYPSHHPALPCSRARKSGGHPLTQPHRAVVHPCTPNQRDTPSPNPMVQSCTRARQIGGSTPPPYATVQSCSRALVHAKSGGPPITPPHRAVVHACTPNQRVPLTHTATVQSCTRARLIAGTPPHFLRVSGSVPGTAAPPDPSAMTRGDP